VTPPRPAGASRELWDKLAVITLVATLVGERVTGRGAVQALDLAVGVPLWEIEPVLALAVGGLLLLALTPPTKLPRQSPALLLRGTLFRLSAAALAVVIVAEAVTGKGALSLLELETGVGALSELEAIAAFIGLLFLTAGSARSGGEGGE
jgi:photosystem II protein